MTDLKFRIEFHQPFFVASGSSGNGLDAVARVDSYLPASSLKGAMRAAASNVLGLDPTTVDEVFGGAGGSSSWAWADATPNEAFHSRPRARIQLDSSSGVVRQESLALTEEVWVEPSSCVTFTIEQLLPLPLEDVKRHRAILIVAAHAVSAVGSWRNRGLGAVSLRLDSPQDEDTPNSYVDVLWPLRRTADE